MKCIYLISKAIAGWFILLAFALLSCEEAPIGQTPTNKTPPPPLTDVMIEPTFGGAHVTYTLPDVKDISYVKCEYEYKGVKHTVRSSIYKNYMDIEGLGAPEEIELRISLVNHSEISSTPYIEKFLPLEPAITGISNSLTVESAFGGFNLSWENPMKVMVGISIFTANDSTGLLELKDMVFSSLPIGTAKVRGFSVERFFSFVVSDKYANISDTVEIKVLPLYEVELDKRNFGDVALNGDNRTTTSGNLRPITNLWDNNIQTLWVTNPSPDISFPQYFSIDLGIMSKLSRFVIFTRGENYYFAQFTPRTFSVWGTDELAYPPNDAYYSTGKWKGDWTFLGDYEVIKPSGSPMNVNTPEDIAAVDNGFEFEFPQDVPNMRYIRFEVHETYSGIAAIELYEIFVYGDDRE